MQFHYHRTERWNIIKGFAKVIKGENEYLLKPKNSIQIEPREIHRIENIGDEDLEFLEIQTGIYLGEDDIVRIEDMYNRELGDLNILSNTEFHKA